MAPSTAVPASVRPPPGTGTCWRTRRSRSRCPDEHCRGTATPVTAPDEWIRAYRALTASLGVIGRLTVGDVRGLDDAELLAVHGGLPLVRITPIAFVPGPLDPGGRFWLVPWAASAVLAVVLAARLGRSRR